MRRKLSWCVLVLFVAGAAAGTTAARPAVVQAKRGAQWRAALEQSTQIVRQQARPGEARRFASPAGTSGSLSLLRSSTDSFADAVGDNQGGLAPDIQNVAIGDAGGLVGIGIDYANRTCATVGDVVLVLLDTDRNPATGSAGADYGLIVDGNTNRIGAARWDGTQFVPFDLPGFSAACTAEGFDALYFPPAALGITGRFGLVVAAGYSDGTSTYFDFAPEVGFHLYTLTGAPAPSQCSDGLDNDGNGLIDYPTDPGCASAEDPEEGTAPPPPPPPPPEGKTVDSAPSLPTRDDYTGELSIKHRSLSDVVYRTMKQAARPKMLAIACWAPTDWRSVVESMGGTLDGDTILLGFWLSRQPRWLHLSPGTCRNIQALLSTKRGNAPRAFALSTALHEAAHAYGIRNEAQANCYSVQLVPLAAQVIGLSAKHATALGRQAVGETRRTAPPGYWNATNCRDGGRWDLDPDGGNLRTIVRTG